MIDGLKSALTRIMSIIPQEVLMAAFTPWDSDMTLDAAIMKKVLLARVRDDISVRGGKILKIMLNLDWCEYTSSPSPYALGISGSYSTYRIPPEARENRDISCVLSVRFPYTISTSTSGSFYNSAALKGNNLQGLACAALQSQTGNDLLASPTGIIRPGNVLQLDPPQYNWVPWQVTVRLRYDDNFSGMDVSTILPFCEVCEYAVKSYIYTKLLFPVETNMVIRGYEVGIMKDIVNSYSDADEKYNEALLALGGAEVFEPQRLEGILRRMVPKR